MPEWDPERAVDPELARALIEARVPELRGAPIERLAEGWDNVVSFGYGALVGPARAAFLDAYGPVDGLTELRARVIAVFLAAALLDYAADTGLDPLRGEASNALARAVA